MYNIIIIKSGINIISLTISKQDKSEILLTWSEIQKIKNNFCGDEYMYEYYPTDTCVINNANERHLWSKYALSNNISLDNIETITEFELLFFTSII